MANLSNPKYWIETLSPSSWTDEGGTTYDQMDTRYTWNPASGYANETEYLMKTRGIPEWLASYIGRDPSRMEQWNEPGKMDEAGFVLPGGYASYRGTGAGLFDPGFQPQFEPDDSGQQQFKGFNNTNFYADLAKQTGAQFAIPLNDLLHGWQSSRLAQKVSFDELVKQTYQNPKVIDVPGIGRVLTAQGVNNIDWGLGDEDNGFFDTLFKEMLPAALGMYGAATGLGSLFGGAGLGSLGAGAGAGALGGAAELASLAELPGFGGIGSLGAGAATGAAGLGDILSTLGSGGAEFAGSPFVSGSGGSALAGAETIGLNNLLDIASQTGIEDPSTFGNLGELTQLGTTAAGTAAGTLRNVGTAASALNNLLGTNLTDEDLRLAGITGSTLLSLLGNRDVAGSLGEEANRVRQERKPFLDKANEYLANPEAYYTSPAATGAANAALSGLSVTGNPINSPTKLAMAQKSLYGNYMNDVLGLGSLGLGGQGISSNLSAQSAQSAGNQYNVLGGGLGAILNPPNDYSDFYEQLGKRMFGGLGSLSMGSGGYKFGD